MAKNPESNGIPEELTPDDDAKGRSIIEAVLTASDAPVTATQLVGLVGGDAGAKEIRQYIDELNEVYVKTGRAFRVTEVAGGFQFSVHHEFAPWIRQLLQEKPARLSQAALEVLSIVAFKQPITKAEVEHIRGVASDGVLRHLMEKGLVRIAGRSDAVGRPLLYGTARDFLKFFGLKTLADLPKVREVEDLLKEEAEEGSGLPPEESEGEVTDPESAETSSETTEGEPEAEVLEEGVAEGDAVESEPAEESSEPAEEDHEADASEDDITDDSAEEDDLEDVDEGEMKSDAPEDDVAMASEEQQPEEGEVDAGTTEQISGEGGSRIEESV
jgi:segregation and condensation protein B